MEDIWPITKINNPTDDELFYKLYYDFSIKCDIIPFNINELHKVFPEARSTIEEIVRNQKKELATIKEQQAKIKNICYSKVKNLKNIDFVTEMAIYAYGDTIRQKELEENIKRNTVILNNFKMGNSTAMMSIEQAKQIPITNFIEVNKAGFAKCPFHGEKTGSFKYYKESNSFYCFGCNEGGDVITFIQKLKNCSLKEALSILHK